MLKLRTTTAFKTPIRGDPIGIL